jgi:hypothetical protein
MAFVLWARSGRNFRPVSAQTRPIRLSDDGTLRHLLHTDALGERPAECHLAIALTGVAIHVAEHRSCTKAVWLRHGGGLDADVPCAIIGNGIGKLVWTKKS